MFGSKRLKTKELIEFCRSLRFSLTSGLMLRETMELVASKGLGRLRPVADQVTRDLKGGWRFQEALEKQSSAFPPVFLALTSVGEESGHLPEVLGEMEKYYELQQKIRRDFIAEITWPVVQFVFSLLVLSVLIYLMGILQPAKSRYGPKPMEPLGFGLLGLSGAVTFFCTIVGTLLLLWLGIALLKRLLSRRATMDWVLLHLPVIGPCLRAVAMTRFCVALQLMLETNVSVRKTLRLALLASDNQVFVLGAPRVETALRQGHSIPDALAAAGVFSEAFLGVVSIADASGHLPEALHYQAAQFDEMARRRLVLLNRVISWLIWLSVAACIGTAICRIFLGTYYRNINQYIPSD